MGISVTLANLTNLNNQTSAVSSINNNSQTITGAFTSALNLTGDRMTGQLDMNNQHIVNLPVPQSQTEPLRVIDAAMLNSGSSLTVQGVPVGGSTGYVLTKHSNTNYDTQWSPIPAIANGVTNQLAYYTTASGIGSSSAMAIAGTASVNNFVVGSGTSVGNLVLNTQSGGTGTINFVSNTGAASVTFPAATTNFGTTGGTNQVLQQSASGGAITVGTLSAANLINGTTGTGSVVLSSSPTFTGNNFLSLNQLPTETMGYSILGNPTGGTANYAPFQIPSLAAKASPTGADILMISDQAASGQLKQATISNIVASQVSGVASINGVGGPITVTDNGGGAVTMSSTNLILGSPGGMLNKIINGTMDVWQRGNTVTVATASSYTADRWFVGSASGTTTVTQASGRSSGNTVYSMMLTGASSANLSVNVQQRIESFLAAPMSNSICTFQAWVFNNTGSTVTPTFSFVVPNTQDSYGSASTYSATSLQACPASTWTQVSCVFSTPSVINGMAPNIAFGTSLNASTRSISITEVDVRETPGAAANQPTVLPPAELRPITVELPQCQRYFHSTYNLGTAPGTANSTSGYYQTQFGVAGGLSNTSWTMCVYYPFKITMRSTPSVTTYSPITGTAGKVRDGETSNDLTPTLGGTGSQGVNIIASTISTTFPFWYGHLTASAEL